MRLKDGKTVGDLVLRDDVELVGIVTGMVTVKAGATVLLRGLVVGSLVIERGAAVKLLGMVCGDVRNCGDVHVHGTIGGRLLTFGGTSVVERNAYLADNE